MLHKHENVTYRVYISADLFKLYQYAVYFNYNRKRAKTVDCMTEKGHLGSDYDV